MPVSIIGTAFCSIVNSTLRVVHFAGGQHGPHFFARPLVPLGGLRAVGRGVVADRRRGQQIEQPLFDAAACFVFDFLPLALAHQRDGVLDQLADHALHVAAVVADFGVLRGLDLDERGAGQLGQPPGDFGLADAGGADHQDILGRDFAPHVFGQLLPPPTIADRDGHGPLGVRLADDMPIQLGDDLREGSGRACATPPPTMFVFV